MRIGVWEFGIIEVIKIGITGIIFPAAKIRKNLLLFSAENLLFLQLNKFPFLHEFYA